MPPLFFGRTAFLRPVRICAKYTISRFFICEFLCNLTIDIFPKVWYNNNVRNKS